MIGRLTTNLAFPAAGFCLAHALLGWGSATVQGENAPVITIQSLLNEMTDRDALARWPQPAYRLREFSGYDRASKTPEDPKGWFANKDHNQFIRVEETNGRREWVIMDHNAPGAIVRWWMPDKRIAPGKRSPVKTVVRIYLDGARTPAIEGHMLDLFNGSGLVPPPLAHKSLSSAVSFLPIAYARSCKVTVDEEPFYYILTCREYAPGAPIRTFAMSDLKEAGPVIERVGKALLAPANAGGKDCVQWKGLISPGAGESLALPAGPAAVRTLSLKLGAYDGQITRSLVLKIEFDGQPTVWCPVGEFFGTGVGLNPFQDWYRTVAADGTMICRWVMPYQRNGRITLVNYQKTPVEASLGASASPWTWDDRSMYFHANWRRQFPLPTRPFSDWNYVTMKGRGVYVGDTLTLMNPVVKWWGEGDAKIWVDGERFPSMFGTGTEDYYGYSWGGRNISFFEHPFHAQVRVGPINRLRPAPAQYAMGTLGIDTLTRTRALDAIPCVRSLQVDMEVWHSADCSVDYAVCTYWYGFAETTCNRGPEPEEAAKVAPSPSESPAMVPRAGKKAAALPALRAALHAAGLAGPADVIFRYSPAEGLGPEKGVMRRDPSDIIRVGDVFYVWYSKGKVAHGYDATVWYATSPDGLAWSEKGEVLARGGSGAWDEQSVFTPNILVAQGKYWLFYTGVPKPFTNEGNQVTKSGIGLAVADSPDGPWKKLETNPILKPTEAPAQFDSMRVDDTCLIVREGKYWMYYKGRQWNNTPSQTKMGVAIAEKPQGPYVKYAGNPVISGGHEVLVWPLGTGVAAMVNIGPKGIARTIQYAPDGLRFSKLQDLQSVPSAAGAYRPEAFTGSGNGKMLEWGIHIGQKEGFLPFLGRFDCEWGSTPSLK